jgi:NAD(P)H-hydrate epimerase
LVDALFGTGLDRELTGALRELIERMNAAKARKISLDLPSGLASDTGNVLGICVQSHVTITFGALKLGLLTARGAVHSGRVEVCDIGVPADFGEVGTSAELVEAADVTPMLTLRSATLHKSGAGRVLVVAGSPGKIGASLLSALGAQRAGAGLVTIATNPLAAQALDGRVLEAMTARIDEADVAASLAELLAPCDAVVVGPGLGLDSRAREIVDAVVFGWSGNKVVDADALTHFRGRARELSRARNVVLTPHAGELSRLLETTSETIEDDRFAAVARAVELTSACVLLKGRYTIVGAPGKLPRINPTGNPVLATGGSGDVLSGVIAALACHVDPFAAAWVGAYLHGAAADGWVERRRADRGMLAHELADSIPDASGASLRAAVSR